MVTGNRADFGFLIWPMRRIAQHPSLELQTLVTGAHLCPSYGHTKYDVEATGFEIHASVDMLLASDNATAVGKSLGLGVMGFSETLPRLAPDLVMLLGDRYETLAAATACLIHGIPVAHLAGGDASEGSIDEQMRHAITKMSHLHFVTHEEAGRRVIQMGEAPERVFVVGSTSLDQLSRISYHTRDQVFSAVGLAPRAKNIVVSFHPVTLDQTSSVEQLSSLLDVLDSLSQQSGHEVGMVLTGANTDTEGASLNEMLLGFAEGREHVVFRQSLEHGLFLNLLAQVDAVVGNSSCGMYEAPSFGIPTVNLGSRQDGRVRARSIIDCPIEREAMLSTIAESLTRERRDVHNPYGDGNAAGRIVDTLNGIADWPRLLRKRFHHVGETSLHVVEAEQATG